MSKSKFLIIGKEALLRAYKLQRRLLKQGNAGEIVSKNEAGDKATRADVESEKEIIEYLKKEKFPARVISEEHGLVDLVTNPTYLVVLDGVDGSSGLVANPNSRCGTMLAISNNLDPTYNKFIFSGITEFSTKRIVYGIKNRGTFLVENPGTKQKVIRIKVKEIKRFNENTKIHIDDPEFYQDYKKGITAGTDEISNLMRQTFINKMKSYVPRENLSGLNSSGAMCIDLLLGEVDLVCGVIAKGVFEPPTEYVLLRETGGTLMSLDGEDIGNKKWLKYGRPLSPLVRASSRELGKEFVKYLRIG